LPKNEEPSPSNDWEKAATSLRKGIRGPPLYLWYNLGKTAAELSPEEHGNLITELDLLYGEDVPWYGFQKLEPPTIAENGRIQATWVTYRRGVKRVFFLHLEHRAYSNAPQSSAVPRAPPLHFSHSGKFKILQVADLHYSVSRGICRETEPICQNSDNLTSSLLANVIEVEKPDLVIFTGDQLNGQGTSWDPKSVLAKFAKAVTDRGIPWAAVFGNHDDENGAGREEQALLMQALPYSLVERGPKDVHGVGNYVLNVLSADA